MMASADLPNYLPMLPFLDQVHKRKPFLKMLHFLLPTDQLKQCNFCVWDLRLLTYFL